MKVICNKCFFDYIVIKFVENLKLEDYFKIVKYVEGFEYLVFCFGDYCFYNKVMFIK